MDDGYGTCPYCKWAGKLRKDGTMRKHREAVDAGRIGSTGSLPQAPHGSVCKGSGEEPWDYTPPEGGYKIETTEHGGSRLVDADEVPEESRTLVDPHTWLRGRLNKRYVVEGLGPNYFVIRDTRTGLDVGTRTCREEADARAAALNCD
jgi:hypothetical protein